MQTVDPLTVMVGPRPESSLSFLETVANSRDNKSTLTITSKCCQEPQEIVCNGEPQLFQAYGEDLMSCLDPSIPIQDSGICRVRPG